MLVILRDQPFSKVGTLYCF